MSTVRVSSLLLFGFSDEIRLYGWHIARLANSFITFGLWYFAKEKLRTTRQDAGEPSLKSVEVWLTLRRVFTILVTRVDWKAIPPIHVSWLPWR